MPSPTTNPVSSRIAAEVQAALQAVGNAFGALRATAQGTLSPIFTLTSALQSLGQAAAAGGVVVGAIANQFAKLTATMGAMTAAMVVAGNQLARLPLAVLEKSIASVGNEIGRFVKLAQPGVFQRFELSVRDLYASIGIALIPVLDKATQIFRTIGSAIYSLTANGQRAIQVIAAMGVAFVTFGAVLAGIAVAAVVGTVALKGFAAAMALVQAIASGGTLIPVLAAIGSGMEFVGVAGAAMAGVLGALSGVMIGVTAVVTDLTPALNQLARTFMSFMDSLGVAFKSFANAGILQSLTDAFSGFVRAVGLVIRDLAPTFATLLTAFGKFVPVVGQIVTALVPAVSALASAFGNIALIVAEVAVALGSIVVAPFVAAIMAVGKALEAIRPLLDSFTVAFSKAFVELVRVVFEFAKAFGAVATAIFTPLMALMGGLKNVGNLFDAIGKAAEALGTIFTTFAGLIVETVKLFGALAVGLTAMNPVVQLFLGTMQAFGKVFRVAGAVAESFGEAFGNVFTAMSELVSDLVVVMGELFQSFIVFNPVLELTLNVVKTLGIQFAALALVISDMVVSVIGWVREFLGLSSLKTIAKQEPKITDNTGAAATSVSTGKPEDALRKARESAFQMGTGGAMKPEEQTAKNTDEIKKAILEAKASMQDFFKNIPGQIEAYINTGVTNIVNGVGAIMDKGLKIANPLGSMPGGKPTGTALDNLPPVSLGGVIAKQLEDLKLPRIPRLSDIF